MNHKKDVFVIGSLLDPMQTKAMHLKAEELLALNYGLIVTTPFTNISTDVITDVQRLRRCTVYLSQSEELITLPDWHQDKFAVDLVVIARLLKIEVKHIVTYMDPKVLSE